MAQCVENLPAIQETEEIQVQSLGRKIPWRQARQPTPVFLPREPYGQRSFAGYSPQGHKESDMTKVTEHTTIKIPMTFFRTRTKTTRIIWENLYGKQNTQNSKTILRKKNKVRGITRSDF